MLLKFWDYISSIGLKEKYDKELTRRITLANQFSCVALIIFLLSGINNLILGDIFSFFIIEGFVVVCLIGLYFNRLHYHLFATIFLFCFISLAIFYFDSYSGMLSGTYLYYFPLILAIAFLFDFKKDKKTMLFHFSLIITLMASNAFTHYNLFKSNFITDDKRYQMFIFNLLFSAGAVGFFIYLTVKNNLSTSHLYQQRIAERELAEKTIKQTIAEKDILLTELHHRVKNNLAVIAGLFSLKLDSVKNEEAKEVLLESRNRVRSMALIHNRLYKNSNFANVNFDLYINELISEIKLSYPAYANTIAVNTHISNITLNVNTAIPCGLILNELLTNCYKHAFKEKPNGSIYISFSQEEDKIKLIVKDNGIGLRPEYETSESLGITVIQSLCEQLEGKYEFTVEEGTCFKLVFDLNVKLN